MATGARSNLALSYGSGRGLRTGRPTCVAGLHRLLAAYRSRSSILRTLPVSVSRQRRAHLQPVGEEPRLLAGGRQLGADLLQGGRVVAPRHDRRQDQVVQPPC
ncbi:hypothetical protein [Streptomyces sp. AM 2-1-1]|uniref:hypothetical protein n=1 Tax=Streptomyces sp. AM 2-1-1 TaxID=3028709 RepID=UPI0023BA1178|nr:hypothetical protein [Streptomyces sp. AM 2-1-1]WEH38090.1 hypothetical protein PZB77_00375 [Streptomyces sp. AM 2-1-1]